MKGWGLRVEIVVSLALLVAAAAGLMGLVVLKLAQQEMVALEIKTGLALATSVEQRWKPGSSEDFPGSIGRILAGTDYQRLVVMDRTGRVLTAHGGWPWPGRPTTADLKEAMSSGEIKTYLSGTESVFSRSQAPGFALAVPIWVDRQVVGAVGLSSSMIEISSVVTKIKKLILVYLALDTLVAVLFGTYLLSRRFVLPLTRLTSRIEDLAAGRYHPGVGRPALENEIGRLESVFEDMATRLLESQERLKENIVTLKAAQEGLVRSEKMATVGRLAAGLAHELGNPIGALIGFIHLLKRTDLSAAEREDFLQRMESEISRMDEIIRSLLDFARPAPAKPGPVPVNQVVEQALRLASVQKWYGGLDVALDLDPDLPPARAELNRLTQVLLNLMSNAGQAMSGQGRLTITTGRKEGEVFFEVADNGPGLATEDIDHIFEPFFTRKAPGQGTGLGLSVSLSIVEAFGGRIEVENRSEGGARFRVILPIVDRPAA